MGLKELVDEAKQRLQRRWPALMIAEHERILRHERPGAAPVELKRFKVLVAQDVDAGVQFLAVVAEAFGSAGEHHLLPAQKDALLMAASGLEIKTGSAFDPHKQWVSSAVITTSRVLHIFTDAATVPYAEILAAFSGSGLHPVLRDRAYWAAHDEARPPDLFICHDTADKAAFVRPLVDALNSRLVKVWYDEQSLSPGDSLVESVETGLKAARYGILVLSPSFLANKRWAAREFRSLVTRDIAEERRIMVPIWLGVDRSQVAAYSLDLADRVAVVVNADTPPEKISDQLIGVLRLTVPDLHRPRE